jgi:hypothetical protein
MRSPFAEPYPELLKTSGFPHSVLWGTTQVRELRWGAYRVLGNREYGSSEKGSFADHRGRTEIGHFFA